MIMQSGWKLSARIPASKSRRSRLDPEVIALAKVLPEHGLERCIRPDHQDFIVNLGLQIAQGHSMLLEEPQEVLPRNAPILRTGDSITTQAARIKPLADGPGRRPYKSSRPGRL